MLARGLINTLRNYIHFGNRELSRTFDIILPDVDTAITISTQAIPPRL